MGLRTYMATGMFLRAMERVLGINLRVSGAEHLTGRPTLFVVNHFTRFETMIVPYVTHRYISKQVRSLADDALFKGVFGRYLASCGVMSVREPLRNRTIIGDLITGRHNWVIYPEGLMMKNKKIVTNGRLTLNCPGCHGSLHTGAAVLALKTEIAKNRYLAACAAGHTQKAHEHGQRYGVESPQQICRDGTVILPVNITYYPLRPEANLLSRLAKWIRPDLSARIDEELQVEGKILLEDTDMSIHFGPPIGVAEYLDKPTEVLRWLAGLFSKQLETDLLLKRQAKRLTHDAMGLIYRSVEINFDHLFCYGLYTLKKSSIPIDQMRRALYLSALELRQRDGLRLHPHLQNDLTPLVTGGSWALLDSIVALAQEDGVLRVESGRYHIDQDAMTDPHDFHAIRLNNAVQVIANELEPVDAATTVIRRNIHLDDQELKRQVSKFALQADRHAFRSDYSRSCSTAACKPTHVGEPFFLEAPGAQVGVVLAHGYLSAPQEIRPLAQHLHARGISVYGVRLEGHGTTPEKLIQVSWRDWMRSFSRGYATVHHSCERVVVGGFSLGGVLAMCLAATHHQAIAGVFSINAPMKLRDRRTAMIPAVLWWNHLMSSLKIHKGVYDSVPNEDTENPGINYEVNYLRGTRQLQLAVAHCRKHLAQITVPALVVQSDADPLVHPSSARLIHDQLGSQVKALAEMDFDRHVIVRGEGSEKVFEKVGSFIDSCCRAPVGGPPVTR